MKFSTYFKKKLVEEGGIAGSMAHIHNVLTPEQAFVFFDELLSGNLDLSEKLDGVQLMVGCSWTDNKVNVLAARNSKDAPTTDIESLFPKESLAHDVFNAGFAAITEKFSKLSKEELLKFQLINEDGSSKYFINLEIVYGEIPNIIQYNEDLNYIKFHMYSEGPSGDWANVEETKENDNLLKELAATGEEIIEVTITGSSLGGDINGKIERIYQEETSQWKFIGTINVPKEKIIKDMKNTAAEWKNFPEAVEVKKFMDDEGELSKAEQKEAAAALKALTLRIGSEILSTVTSELFKEGAADKMPEGHPKIEGLIAKGYKGHDLLKVTGDFPAANAAMTGDLGSLEGEDNGMKDYLDSLKKLIMNEMLQLKNKNKKTDLKMFPQKLWDEFNRSGHDLLLGRSTLENYKLSDEEKKKIMDKIEWAQEGMATIFNRVENHVKKEFLQKMMYSYRMLLNNFHDAMKNVNSKQELAEVTADVLYKRGK